MVSLLHGKKRVLILTGDSGFGHRSAANSISKALNLYFPNQANTIITNPLSDTKTPFFIRKSEVDYDNNVLNHASLYRFMYELTNLKSTSVIIENTITLFMQKNIQDLIERHKPNVIVTTNQWFNTAAGAALSKTDRDVPLFTVVTDLSDLHLLWFSPKPDRYYVASNVVRAEAIENGIQANRIVVSGIPVDPSFLDDKRSKQQIKTAMGLDPARKTVLFIGSKRVRQALPFLQALNTIRHPFELVAITGGDDELFLNLTHQRWAFPIHVRNYVTNIPDWMKAADILITKAGGLILSEGMAAGLPMLLIDFLPGQEEGNVRFAQDRGLGVLTTDISAFTAVVERWLDPSKGELAQVAANSRRSGHPDSSVTIAADLIEACSKPVRRPALSLRKVFN